MKNPGIIVEYVKEDGTRQKSVVYDSFQAQLESRKKELEQHVTNQHAEIQAYKWFIIKIVIATPILYLLVYLMIASGSNVF